MPAPQPATSIKARKPGFVAVGKSLQTKRDDAAVFAGQLRNVSNCANSDYLQEGVHLRFPPTLAKQRVNELESDAHAGKILIGIVAAALIRIQHGVTRRNAFAFIGKMVIGDDYIESVIARPVEWFVRAYAAVNANGQFIVLSHGSLKRGLLNSVAFSETVRHMKSGLRSQQVQCSQENGRSRGAVNIIVAVNEYGFP